MIETFADKHTLELYNTGKSKRLPPDIVRRARRKLEYVDLALVIDDLKVPPGNQLHRLSGNRRDNMLSVSTINGVSAFTLLKVAPLMSK